MSREPAQHRYERKFAITGASLAQVENLVRHHPALFFQEYASRLINNIYLDSPDLRNYHQNVNGDTERAKLRARWYGQLFGAVPQAILEQKCKRGLLGMKHSARLPGLNSGNRFPRRTCGAGWKPVRCPRICITRSADLSQHS